LVAFAKTVGVWTWGFYALGLIVDIFAVVVVTELILFYRRYLDERTHFVTVITTPVLANLIIVLHGYIFGGSPHGFGIGKNDDDKYHYIGIIYQCGLFGPNGFIIHAATAYYIQTLLLSIFLCLVVYYIKTNLSNKSLEPSP